MHALWTGHSCSSACMVRKGVAKKKLEMRVGETEVSQQMRKEGKSHQCLQKHVSLLGMVGKQ